jgi:Flp pilus assembly protein TadG
MTTVWKKLGRAFGAFRAARGGNVAITFAIAAIPILGAVGAAVDYSRANDVKAKLQAAIDATALMISKEAATDTSTELQTNASNYFFAMFKPPGVKDVTINAVYTGNGATSLIINATASVPTTIAQIFGIDAINLTASTTSKWGETRLRVALVLDNTGSMGSAGKLDALKTATGNLLTQLQNAATVPDDVYVSIVPFVKDVSVDPSNYNASWIYWGTSTQDPGLTDNNSWDAQNGACTISGKSSRSSCTSAGTCSISGNNSQSSCTSATTQSCSIPKWTTKNKCQNKGGTWTTTAGVWTPGAWTPKTHNSTNWNGCITDRGTPTGPVGNSAGYDQDVTAPTSDPATLFPAEQYSSCPQAIMGLNYNWTAMNALVSNMTANGNTNQPIGLVWGWQTLVGGGPFTAPTMDPNYKYKQVIILLSDGMNTQDRWSSSQNFIDNRMYDSLNGNGTCANIKAAGIEIYTIQVNTGSDPTSTLLQNCASNSAGTTDHFYLLTSASQIITVFNQIGTALSQLRIAQ